MADILLVGRIALSIISIISIVFIVKARTSHRLGNQFFVIMILFWVSILIISVRPDILDSVINETGFVNKAQLLLSLSILIISYSLIVQVRKGKSLSENFSNTIRKIALSTFVREYSKTQKDLVIVIVAKNESDSIGEVIENVSKLKLDLSYQIIVVNDGSTDNTEKISREKGALVITHFVNLGIGGAIKTGYLASMILSPKYVINIDADGQHDPAYIQKILSILEDGADLVYGSRFSLESDYTTNAVRFVGNKFYTSLVNRIGNISITDVTSGYRGIRASKIKSIYFLAETNFAIELALRAARNNLKIGEISIKSKMRQKGSSQFYKIERFIIYNINAIIQIFNAYFKEPKIPENYERID